MKVHAIKEILNKIAPVDTQAEWDNSGVQICFGEKDVKSILVAMEISDDVITEAIEKKVDMIVTHHPLIFEPIKSIHVCDPRSRYVIRLIKAGIIVYSAHTPFDKAKGGNTDYLLKLVGGKSIMVVEGTEGYLKTAVLSETMKLGDFVYMLSKKLELDGIRFTGDSEKMIKTVACCTGQGGEFWSAASKCADALITGDTRHHEAQYSNDIGLALVDAGHWGTEQIFVPNMAKQLKVKLGDKVEVIESNVNQDPYYYMV